VPDASFNTRFAYTYLDLNLDDGAPPGASDLIAFADDLSPRHQLSLLLTLSWRPDLSCNLWFRYVDARSAKGLGDVVDVPSGPDPITAVNANVTYRPRQDMEVVLAVENLFAADHVEYVSEYLAPVTRIPVVIRGLVRFSF